MVIMISYDLNNHEKPSAYQDVADMIKRYAKDQRKPLRSQWFVYTDDSVETWNSRMETVTDKNDSWFIVQIKPPYNGWLPKDFWDWLRVRI